MPAPSQPNIEETPDRPVAYHGEGGSRPTSAAPRRRHRPKVAAVAAPSPTAEARAAIPTGEQAPSTQRWPLPLLASGVFTALVLAVMVFLALNANISLSVVTGGFTVRFLSLFVEAAPFLLLGSIVSGLIDTFVSPDHIARLVPRNRLLGVLMGTFAGFVFPVCECGVVPVVRQLYSKKLPASVGLAFLLAAPVMNPTPRGATWPSAGTRAHRAATRNTALVAIIAGMAFALRGQALALRVPSNERPVPSTEYQVLSSPSIPGTQRPAPEAQQSPRGTRYSVLGTRYWSALQVAVDEFFDMGRFLVIGSLLAAGMQTMVSQNVLASLGQGPFASVITMQAVAFVLSVCSTVDAFLALAFAGAFSTGSILAFLTFGPMVDIKTTTMFLGVFQRKTVAWLTVLPFVLTALAGITLNLLGVH